MKFHYQDYLSYTGDSDWDNAIKEMNRDLNLLNYITIKEYNNELFKK